MASFATQVQIRRGTDAENDAFTGAEGEVTMDLTNKQLRVHDGQTKGGMKIPNIKTVFGTNQIANNAVTEEKIADNAVTGGKIADGAVSLGKLGNNSVNTSKIVNDSITPEKLIGQPTFTGNAGKTLAVNPAGNGFEFIESTLPENSDYVIESQEPTEANGYTWYRLYKSGWVEQGGYVSASGDSEVSTTYPIELQDPVCPDVNFVYGFQSELFVEVQQVVSMSTTGFTTRGRAVNDMTKVWENADFYWRVVGYAAPAEYTKDKWDYQNVQVERPMVQLFNSATDEAVATCTEVLADVAELKQTTDGMIDYVVESQEPTEANGYTWYRLYKSGWVEQGVAFKVSGGDSVAVVLPIEMNNRNYNICLTQYNSDTSVNSFLLSYYDVIKTGFSVVSKYATSGVAREFLWQVSGMSAQGA